MTNYNILKEYEAHQTPVPSYKEWKDLKSKLQLKETAYDFDTARLEAENAQLTELLKECSIANTALVGIMDWLRKSIFPEQRENCEEIFKHAQELQKQLDEVLK